jgi:hypothetical protein
MKFESSSTWLRVVAAGVLWSALYNSFWGLCWFMFMRHEWTVATAAAGMQMPWTAEVWFLWVALTIPIGIAMAAYWAGQGAAMGKASLVSAGAVWLLLAGGMSIWCVQASLPIRVAALDALVNLIGMLGASLLTVGALRASSGTNATVHGSSP